MKTKKTVSQLPTIVIAMLSGLISDTAGKAAKKELPQDKTFEGELTIRIPYRVSKGENYDTKPTVSILSKAVLAKALVYSGITADAYKAALLKAATESLNAGEAVGDNLTDEDQRILDQIDALNTQVIALLPRQPRNGMVKVHVLTDDQQPEIVQHIVK